VEQLKALLLRLAFPPISGAVFRGSDSRSFPRSASAASAAPLSKGNRVFLYPAHITFRRIWVLPSSKTVLK
jgi:hypothetical protein